MLLFDTVHDYNKRSMSHDQYHSSYNYFDESDVARTKAIAVLSVGVVEKMNVIGQGYPEQYSDELDYIAMGARLSQFEVLANAVVEVARDQVMKEQPFYLLDDIHFHVLESELKLQDRLSEFFDANTTASRDAIAKGMRAGTDDFLRILVPEDIARAEPEHTDTYFMPWAKNMLTYVKPRYVNKTSDEEFEVFLPTALPNIYVAHVYSKDSNFPAEELRLIADPTYLSDAILASSQQ